MFIRVDRKIMSIVENLQQYIVQEIIKYIEDEKKPRWVIVTHDIDQARLYDNIPDTHGIYKCYEDAIYGVISILSNEEGQWSWIYVHKEREVEFFIKEKLKKLEELEEHTEEHEEEYTKRELEERKEYIKLEKLKKLRELEEFRKLGMKKFLEINKFILECKCSSGKNRKLWTYKDFFDHFDNEGHYHEFCTIYRVQRTKIKE